MSFDIMSQRTRGNFWGLTCWCVYSYPQHSLKNVVVNFPNLVPAWCRSTFFSSSAQARTWTSSVKMFVFVIEASLSGDSTTILQLRGETTTRLSHCMVTRHLHGGSTTSSMSWCQLLSYGLEFLESSPIDPCRDRGTAMSTKRPLQVPVTGIRVALPVKKWALYLICLLLEDL